MKSVKLLAALTAATLLSIGSLLWGTLPGAASTQGTWSEQQSGLEVDLNCICFIDSSVGWAAGDEGKMIKTTDGGIRWTEQSSGITSNINSIFFIDAGTGWIGADGGVILHSVDGGANWTEQTTPTTNSVYDIEFISSSHGYAFCRSGKVLKTTDGGANWEQQNSGLLNWINAGAVVDADTVYAGTTSGHILHTADGGASWLEQTAPVEIAGEESINGVCAISADDIWMVSNGDYIIHTVDGESWTATDAETGDDLEDVDFTDADSGWVVGTDGTILCTSDGGASWQDQSTDITEDLLAINMIGINLGYAVGTNGAVMCYCLEPQAAFSADATSATSGDTINFIDQSTNMPSSWAWDFGDGSTSAEQNPAHIYTAPGAYTVSLTVSNTAGSASEVKTDFIAISIPTPVAGFSADITSADTGQTIAFSDQSTNNPSSWLWDFGDGNTSAERNPAHSYSEAGTYSITLTASNSAGSDDETKSDYITVTQATSGGCGKSSAATIIELASGCVLVGALGAATSYIHIKRRRDR